MCSLSSRHPPKPNVSNVSNVRDVRNVRHVSNVRGTGELIVMTELLTFGEAAQRAGVSRQRLNRAIHTGRLPAARGGGPGKPTRIRFEDLQVWCKSEGLPMPINRMERAERSDTSRPSQDAVALTAQPDMAALMTRLERTVEQAIDRAVDQVVERLAARLTAQLSGRLERPERSRRS